MDRLVVAVVLAGGTGTRLYPASSPERPKQLRAFCDDASLLSRAVDRVAFADETHVLTRPDLTDAVRREVPSAAVLAEPAPRDTGPALVYAAHRLREQVGDHVMLAVPSDHRVGDGFAAAARQACGVAARTGDLVVLGVEPTRPATEYGYVRPGEDRGDHRAVAAFNEKPDAETAAAYRERGDRWNAGVFAWTPDALLSAARGSPLAPLVEALDDGDPERGFDAVEPVSVDDAVLERAAGDADGPDVAVVPTDVAWDDLGSWDAIRRVCPTDGDGTVRLGDAAGRDAEDCVLAAGPDTTVDAVGVSDLVVAAYDDRVLVVPTGEAQRVREVARDRFDEG